MSNTSDTNLVSIHDVATHQIIVYIEEGKQYVFEAQIAYDEESFRLYKIEGGDIADETFVEVRDGIIILMIEEDEYACDILDSIIDGPDMHFWCEDDSCNSIEIDATCILNNEERRRDIADGLLFYDDMWDEGSDY